MNYSTHPVLKQHACLLLAKTRLYQAFSTITQKHINVAHRGEVLKSSESSVSDVTEKVKTPLSPNMVFL